MPDTTALTPQDYDPWQLATPLQLFTLLQRLGVSGSEVARWLRVPRSAISMWTHGARAIPPKHLPALREWTRRAFDQAIELNDKAVALAPTVELRQAIRAEFAAIYARWKNEVLYDAGTLQRGLQLDYAQLGHLVSKPALTSTDVETMALICDTLVTKARLIVLLQPEAPSPDDALIARLTEAHEAAAQAREGNQDV